MTFGQQNNPSQKGSRIHCQQGKKHEKRSRIFPGKKGRKKHPSFYLFRRTWNPQGKLE